MVQQKDLKQYALQLLDLSKRFFLEDGELDSVAFIVTADEQILRPIELQSEGAKIKSCKKIVDEARKKQALAIVTFFLARSKYLDCEDFSEETYCWGDLQESGAQRCILVTISGPGIKNWAAALPLTEKRKKTILGERVEFTNGVDFGLFPGWSEQITTPKVS